MKVFVVLFFVIGACCAAPSEENAKDNKIQLFSGVAIETDASGEDRLNVKFEPGELKEAARAFEEARGKVKKYGPLIAGLGVKTLAVIGIVFGIVTLLVTKALIVAKLAFFAAAALGLQKYFAGGLYSLGGKLSGFNSPSAPQWSPPTAASSYPYARSSSGSAPSELAYKAQIPSSK